MKTFVGLCVSSMAFGIAIAAAYWFFSGREAVGTLLLGVMAAALIFAAGYAVLAEREADLPGDAEELPRAAAAGEDLGVFTTQSAWPVLCALSTLAMLVGLLWSPVLAGIALVALVLCLWRMGAESARIG